MCGSKLVPELAEAVGAAEGDRARHGIYFASSKGRTRHVFMFPLFLLNVELLERVDQSMFNRMLLVSVVTVTFVFVLFFGLLRPETTQLNLLEFDADRRLLDSSFQVPPPLYPDGCVKHLHSLLFVGNNFIDLF